MKTIHRPPNPFRPYIAARIHNVVQAALMEELAHGPKQLSDLCADLGITYSRLWFAVRALDGMGFVAVRHAPAQGDQRRRYVELSAKGQTWVEKKRSPQK